MKFGLIVFKNTTNLGDDIQSYSVKKLLPKVDYYIEREKINEFVSNDNEKVKTIVSGWFNHDKFSFPPSPFIDPLFISIHLTNELKECQPSYFTNYFFEYLKSYQPIGLRDSIIKKYLDENNIDNYFSGCTTLTIEKFKSVKKTDNICLVDIDYFTQANIKDKFKNVITTSHYVDEDYTNLSYDERFNYVEKILKTYQSCKLVITTRLHCALPCLALGVPVILVYNGNNKDVKNRLSEYTNMINYVSKDDFKNNYEDIINNYKPNPKYFEKYKINILNTVSAFLKKKNNDNDLNSELYKEYFVKQKNNFETIYNRKIDELIKISNERYQLLKELEKDNYKLSLINEGLKKENELYKNNFNKLSNDFISTNAQLYSITNSKSYKILLKFKLLYIKLKNVLRKLLGRSK